MDKLPEAPASVTYSVMSPQGFPVLFTVRDVTGLELIKKMDGIEKTLLEKGYKPQEKKSYGGSKPAIPVEYADYSCPVCGKRVVKAKTKIGREMEKCETQKYDFNTKAITGCAYVKFL